MIALIIIGCSAASKIKFGHWVNTYPGEFSIWQCVENFKPYKNIEC